MPDQEDDPIVKEVVRHYSESEKPYHLAELGVFLNHEKIPMPDGIKLKDFLQKTYPSKLEIIQDPNTPARIAVALPSNNEKIRSKILGDEFSFGLDGFDARRLPFSLIAAFCRVPPVGKHLYYRIIPPFHYIVAETPRGDQGEYLLIDDSSPPAQVRGVDPYALSPEDLHGVYAKIVEWAQSKGIDPRSLRVSEEKTHLDMSPTSGGAGSNALQRLIEAQEPNLRSQIRVPMDIIAALIRLP